MKSRSNRRYAQINGNDYIEEKTSKGTVWKVAKGDDYETIEQATSERYTELENFQMVAFLGFVVLLFGLFSAALFAGVVRTIALRANPAVDAVWLWGEIKYLMAIVVLWQSMVSFGVIIVHARIGSLIAEG